MRARSGVVALGIFALVLAACGGGAPPSPAAGSPTAAPVAATRTPAPPRDKVKLTGINSTELNLPTLVALGNDYFGAENIELTDLVIGSSGTLRQAMIAKEYDFGLYAFVHVPIARLAGSPFKAVLTVHEQEIFGIIVRSQLKDQVKTVKDLKGKKLGFTTPGSGTWALGNVFVKGAGLTPEKDVELVSLGGDNQVFYTALQSGRVDAIVSFEPIGTKVLADNVGYALLDMYAPGQHRQSVGAEKAAALQLVTREDVIAAKPDLVKRMVGAHKRALDFIRSNSAEAIYDVIQKNTTAAQQLQGFDKALASKVISHIKSGFGTGCVSRSGFDAEMKLSLDYQLVKSAITYEQFADTTWASGCP